MKKRLLAAIITAAAIIIILGAGSAFAVYHGYLHINGLAASRYLVRGVDVSHYQGEIDWQVLSGQNIRFAYIKATEGSSHVDRRFAENCEKAMKTDLKVGAYHFFSFDSPGTAQAEHFIRIAEPFHNCMVPMVDVEFYGNKRDNPPDPDLVEPELKDYLDRLEQACGQKPVIYATKETWELYICGKFDSYPLWIRDIWTEPTLRAEAGNHQEYDWTFWQYTNRGRLKGFSGEEPFVDLNVFYGMEKEWLEFTAGDEK